jgi:hypothetical protein
VDTTGLRQVADVDLEPLKAYVANATVAATTEWIAQRLPQLRQVADLQLGGLL